MEAREAQDLFNDLADIIDFEPESFDQETWGTGLTLERFRDSEGVEDNVVHIYNEDESYIPIEVGEGVDSLSACGTTCCVAGWTVLLKGWHPTITEYNNGEYSETHESYRKGLYGKVKDYFLNFEHKIFELEYGFVADRPGVRNEGWSWHDAAEWENGVLVLEDGVTEVGRVDILAQNLLGLTQIEACILFEGTQPWVGDDLRKMGKGEDVASLSNGAVSVESMTNTLQYGVGEMEYGEHF